MKYLFLVNESESANGICVKTVMKELSVDNEVYCISNEEHRQKSSFVEDNIEFHRVKPRLTYRISSYLSHTEYGRYAGKLLKATHLLLNKAKLLLTVKMWPWISPAYTNRIYNVAEKLCREKNIDCIVTTYTQIDTLIVGNRIKKEFPDIKFIPYFLDSLSGGYGPRQFSEEWVIERGLKWERKLLPAADGIIMMESSREHHNKYSSNEEYFEKIHFLDLPLFSADQNMEVYNQNLLNRDNINLVYVGTLPGGIRSPEYVLSAFKHIPYDNWHLHFVGTADCAELNEAADRDSRIHVIGRCEHSKALEYEMNATALINIGNSNKQMMPSKIFEYASTGKPIITVNCLPDDKCNEYLEKYPASLIINTNDTDYESAAGRIIEFVQQTKEMLVQFETIREGFKHNTPAETADYIRKITGWR